MTVSPHAADIRNDEIVAALLQGRSVRAIARELEVGQRTVRKVRDQPETRARMAEARAKRAETLDAVVEDARRVLREGAVDAAEALRDALGHPDPRVRLRAARELLDRIGIPRIEEVRNRSADLPDLSGLTDEELAQWEALNAKVSRE